MIKTTWTGDSGRTKLFGGEDTTKDTLRLDACGDVDELNSFIGLAKMVSDDREIKSTLAQVQKDLFVIGAELAKAKPSAKGKLYKESITWIEETVAKTDGKMPDLKKFIVPGGTQSAALLHVSRSVCRRAERKCVALKRGEIVSEDVIKYLNRLSSLLFSLARLTNYKVRVKEEEW